MSPELILELIPELIPELHSGAIPTSPKNQSKRIGPKCHVVTGKGKVIDIYIII